MFHGSLVALVTPMHNDGSIDYDSLQRLVTWHLGNSTDGLVILGTTGESATIEPDERAQIIEQVVKQVNEHIPVIVGTGTNATKLSITLTQQAMELGADAALLATPYYNKPTQEGLYQHFKAIAQAVPIPQILYNVPARTGCDLLPETVSRLAPISNIVAIKEATGDMDRLAALIALDGQIDLLSGDDATALDFMRHGGKGVISVVANVVPKLFHDMCLAASKQDFESAQTIDNQLKILYKLLFAQSNPIPTKWALAQMGMMKHGIRLPLTQLDNQYHEPLRSALHVLDIR